MRIASATATTVTVTTSPANVRAAHSADSTGIILSSALANTVNIVLQWANGSQTFLELQPGDYWEGSVHADYQALYVSTASGTASLYVTEVKG